MDETNLKELRNNIRCMDSNELTAFGGRHRANPESVEYLEAKAEWEEFAEMAKAAGPDRYPWMWYEDRKV
jgi:hypothetical protein